jgi:hypothetical protein
MGTERKTLMTSESERLSKLSKALAALQELQEEVEVANRADAAAFWDNLSYEDKLLAFYSVVSRIYDGEIKQKGTYRHILYEVFGFGPEAYGLGMECGFMYLHNAIFDGEELNGSKRTV